ncbi:MAG TPA: hypothetical protein VGL00_01200 [Terracidiphilus sp.]|jgi:hypothetical protein
MITIDFYPANSLEGLIAREWASMILECEDPAINLVPIQAVIEKSRTLMHEAGWPQTYQHKFLLLLRNDITALTFGHPVARQFCAVLTNQLESN